MNKNKGKFNKSDKMSEFDRDALNYQKKKNNRPSMNEDDESYSKFHHPVNVQDLLEEFE